MELIDTSFGTTGQSETLTRICKHASGDLVQVVVHHDTYQNQSYAVAKVFAHDRSGWKELVTAPASSWFSSIDRSDDRTHRRVGDLLVKRAALILDNAPRRN